MAVKPIIIPIQADTSGIQTGIDAIDALGGVDEATAKKFAQSNKIFAEQKKIISSSSPDIQKLTAAITALTESIVGGALIQKLTQIGNASQKAGDISASSAPKVEKLTDSLNELSTSGNVAAINSELDQTSQSLTEAAETAGVLHASFNEFSSDAAKIDFTKLSVQELEATLDDLIKKEGQLKSAQSSTLNPELIAKYDEGIKAVTQDINIVSSILDNLNADKFQNPQAVNEYTESIKSLKSQLNLLNEGTPEFNQAAKELKASEIAATGFEKKAISLRGQLRQYRETLAQLEEAGLENTNTFQKMAIAAGQLDDQIGDTQARIKALASDSFAFDAAIQGAQGVAAAFSIAQGASALFGSENEDLQKALLKVNAATAILTGLQQVQNTIQKQTAIVTAVTLAQQRLVVVQKYLETAAESKNIVVRYAAIVAQRALNAVMAANPATIVLVAISALAAGIIALTSSSEDAKEATERLNDELEQQNKILEANAQDIQRNADLLLAHAKAAGTLESELTRIQQAALKRQADELQAQISFNLARFKNEKLNEDQMAAINKQVIADQEKLDELNKQRQLQKLQFEKQTNDESLRAATAAAKTRVANIKKDTDASTQAQITAIQVGQQQQLAAENLTFEERQQIIAENEEKIRQLTLDATRRRYDDQIAIAQARSLDARNEFKRLQEDIEVVLLTAERDRLGKSKAQQILITSQANEAIRQLRLKLNKDLEEIDSRQLAKDREGRILTSKERLQDEVLDGARAAAARLLRAQDENTVRIQIEQESHLKLKEARRKLLDDSLQSASDIASNIVQVARNQADAQIAILDDQLNRGIISQQAYEAKVRQIKQRAAIQEKQLALFQATISASLAVLAILRDTSIPGVLRPVFIALAVAQAAAQIAAIQSKQIPAFAKGTNNAPGGPALVGEAGGELIYQNSQMSYVAGPTVMNLKKGAKVIPAMETAKILEMYSIPKPYLPNTVVNTPSNNRIDYNKLGKVVGMEVAKMPIQLFGIDERGFTKRTINFSNRGRFLKKRFGL